MGSLIGTKVGNFRVVDLLRRGGMGEVYVGYDEKLERKVALKTIRTEHRLDQESQARFLREARVLSQLEHPNICQIFEYIEGGETDVLALELIHGTKLTDVVAKGLDFRKKLAMAIELAGALVAAHGKGIVHRDLKPDNVMVDDNGHVKILDFGLSRWIEDEETIEAATASRLETPSLHIEGDVTQGDPSGVAAASSENDFSFFHTRFGSILGTPNYMSPEQAQGEPAISASDIYSLGLVLQELFTGKSASLRGGSLAERLERAKSGQSHPVEGLDPDLTNLVERMKSFAPAIRPTAVETVDRLRWIQAKPARRRRRFLTVTALVVLSAFSIGATIQTVLIAKERNRANQERDRAKETLAFLAGTFEVANPRKGRGPAATAQEIIDHARKRLDETKGHPLLQASLAMTLSKIYDEMGLYDAGEPLARTALEIRENALGPGHPEVAQSLENLSSIWRKQGKLVQAEALARRSLEVRESVLGPNHPEVAQSLNELAIIWRTQGRLAEAEPLLKRSLEIKEKALGPDHPDVALALYNLGLIALKRGQRLEALAYMRRAIPRFEGTSYWRSLVEEDPDIAPLRDTPEFRRIVADAKKKPGVNQRHLQQ